MNHVEYFRREWTDDVPLSFHMGKKDNDRKINEWYNEVDYFFACDQELGEIGGIL